MEMHMENMQQRYKHGKEWKERKVNIKWENVGKCWLNGEQGREGEKRREEVSSSFLVHPNHGKMNKYLG